MPQHKDHWKQNAIKKSGGISDAWDVFISYAGRFAAWILFGCMISNIVEVVAPLPAALVSIIMIVQVITLDIAGFGLNTIAKQVSKKGDAEGKRVARKANRLATFLIGLMVLTLALVTTGYLMPSLATIADEANKALILVRVIMIVLYMHTMHELSEAAGDIAEKEEKTEQANDKVALSNQKKIEMMDTQVNGLTQQVNGLVNAVNALTVKVNAVNVSASQVTSSVDLEQFHALSQTVYEMKTSVNQVNQNFLTITQNLYNTPGQRPIHDPLDRHIHEVYTDLTPLQGIAERRSDDYDPGHVQALPVPVLDIPGVPQERVQAAISGYLSGTAWGRLPGKYATNKLIKEAYEIYLSTQGQRVNG